MGLCCPSGSIDSIEPAISLKAKPSISTESLSSEFLEYKVTEIGGETRKVKDLMGRKATLVVNVASK